MLILASTSATRRTILENAGLSFLCEQPEVDETALIAANPQWTPLETALHLAEAKAKDVSLRHSEAIVIGADQVLALEDRIYSKPVDLAAARQQLAELRNNRHQLISAVVCASRGRKLWHATDHATLTMRNFSDEFLDSYLKSVGGRTLKSVGGYQFEGLGIQLFERITGDFYTILGLPLLPLLHYLRSVGVLFS